MHKFSLKNNRSPFRKKCSSTLTIFSIIKGVFIASQLNSTELNSTAWTTVDSVVGRDVINKNTTDLAVYAIQLGQLS